MTLGIQTDLFLGGLLDLYMRAVSDISTPISITGTIEILHPSYPISNL